MNYESLVMKVIHSLKVNDSYKANIASLEKFVQEKEKEISLSEEQSLSLSKAKSQIEVLKDIVYKHEQEINSLLKERNLESIMDVAKILKDDFKI